MVKYNYLLVERGVRCSKHVLYLCLQVRVEHYVAIGVDGKRVPVGAQLESEKIREKVTIRVSNNARI